MKEIMNYLLILKASVFSSKKVDKKKTLSSLIGISKTFLFYFLFLKRRGKRISFRAAKGNFENVSPLLGSYIFTRHLHTTFHEQQRKGLKSLEKAPKLPNSRVFEEKKDIW